MNHLSGIQAAVRGAARRSGIQFRLACQPSNPPSLQSPYHLWYFKIGMNSGFASMPILNSSLQTTPAVALALIFTPKCASTTFFYYAYFGLF
jgi:hypothetical protein